MQLVTGLPFIGISIALVKWASRTMKQAGTDANPYNPSTAIVVDGPFRFSCNPMYLSFTALYIGIAFAVDALWPFVLLPIALVGISLGVIKREERYLEQKFGQDYLRYKVRVRRWI
jgi:protein-S-isoprenylcysteine O-methyltransferase Ste14